MPPSARHRRRLRHAAASVGLLALAWLAAERPLAVQTPQWPMAAKGHQNTRFSELAQTTAANARSLRLAWTFATGVRKGQQAAPLAFANSSAAPSGTRERRA